MSTVLRTTLETTAQQRDTVSVRLGTPAFMPGLRASPGTSPGVASGFDAMMSVIRANVGVDASGGERASPERMFEAQPSGPGERRQATIRDDYRERTARDAEALRDGRSGIEARKVLRSKSVEDESGLRSPGVSAAQRDRAASASEPAPFGGSARVAMGSDSRSGSDGTAATAPDETVRGRDESVHGSKSSVGESALSARTSLDSSPAVPTAPAPESRISNLASGSSSPAVAVHTTPANSAAGEVARLLAGTHPSDLGFVTAPASGDARSAAREPSENSKAKLNPSEQSATSKKAEETRSTPFAQLVRLMRSQAGRQSSARVMLEPPQLGRIHVRVKMLGDRVEVGVETETASAKELLSGRADRLKSALEQQGMIVDRFDINTNATGLFDQRRTVGGGSDFSAQSGGERPAGPGAPGARAGGRSMRSRGEGLRTGVETPVVGSSVAEWPAAGDVRLDIRV